MKRGNKTFSKTIFSPLCKLILHGKSLGFYKRARSAHSSSAVLRRRRNTAGAPHQPRPAHSPAAMLLLPGCIWDVPVPPAPRSLPTLDSYLASGKPRAVCSTVGRHSPGPCCLPAEIPPRWINLGAGVNGAKQCLRWEEVAWSGSAWRRGAVAGDGAYLGSALPGWGWLLPSLRPLHRPPGRPLSAGTAAPRRGSAPGAGWHPSPCLPRASPERLCWEGAPKLMSPALYPPLPTLLGFGPASSTCGLSSPLWAFLPLPFLWLRVSPQTRFYESGLVQGLYKVFSEMQGLVICKTNKNVQ